MPDVQRFPYQTITTGRGEKFPRPILPLRLSANNRSIEAVGLLDTGADVNVVPYHLGLGLGMSWENQRSLAGLSGNLANYEARGIVVTASIGTLSGKTGIRLDTL